MVTEDRCEKTLSPCLARTSSLKFPGFRSLSPEADGLVIKLFDGMFLVVDIVWM